MYLEPSDGSAPGLLGWISEVQGWDSGACGHGQPRLLGAPHLGYAAPELRSRCRLAAGFPTLMTQSPPGRLPRATRGAHLPGAGDPGPAPEQLRPRPKPSASLPRRSAAERALARGRPGASARAQGPAPSEERGLRGCPGGRGRRRRRSRRLPRGSRLPSRSPSASPEPCEGETLSPGMQREEGFNTKMADGPDEYDTEAGCVPLLHPEVRNRAERIPRPGAPGPSFPGLAEGDGLRVWGSGTCRSWEAGKQIQA